MCFLCNDWRDTETAICLLPASFSLWLIFAISATHFPRSPCSRLKDLSERPVKMESDVRYLLVEPLQGVAPDSPELSSSTSNSFSQCGQRAWATLRPVSLMRR